MPGRRFPCTGECDSEISVRAEKTLRQLPAVFNIVGLDEIQAHQELLRA
jgi:hypothetical protein